MPIGVVKNLIIIKDGGGGGGDLKLGETATTAYRGDRGKDAYDHSKTEGNPHNTTKANIGLDKVDNTADAYKPISEAQQLALDAKLTGTRATDAEVQISSGVAEDNKFVSRVTLFNWSISETFRGRVRGILLTGLSTATNAVITASDSIIGALGKLQAQVSAVATASVVSGADSNTTIKNLSTVAAYPGTPVANSLYFVETAEFRGPVSVTVSAGTTVVIPHGQSFVPSFVSVQAKNTIARGTFSFEVDATNVTLTYTSAVTAGTAEYWLRWEK
nr:hypothetical protein [uncultured Flavobacterium sp.]